MNLSAWSWRVTRFTLVPPCLFHGWWNMSDAGARWWALESGLPVGLRWVVGFAEWAAAISLATGVLSRWAAVGLVALFIGALPQHWAHGYSFKENGVEVLVAYATLSLAIALRPPERRFIVKEDS